MHNLSIAFNILVCNIKSMHYRHYARYELDSAIIETKRNFGEMIFDAAFRVFICLLSCLARWKELVELCSALQKAKGKNQNSRSYIEKCEFGWVNYRDPELVR